MIADRFSVVAVAALYLGVAVAGLPDPAGAATVFGPGCQDPQSEGRGSGRETEQIWSGALVAGQERLGLILRIVEGPESGRSAEVFSPDQTDQAFPATDLQFDGEKIRFRVPSLRATFAGSRDAAGESLKGEWSQSGVSIPLEMKRIPEIPERVLLEVWQGTLVAGSRSFDFQVRILSGPDGGRQGLLDSFSESAFGLGLVLRGDEDGDGFAFDLPATAAEFRGRRSADGKKIEGVWKQRGASFPLDFRRIGTGQVRRMADSRRQTPVPPLAFDFVDVVATHRDRGGSEVRLAGTLSYPRGRKGSPVVILVSGSGPQDRDGSFFGHRPFLVLTDYLTRRGIATLRFDDRGTGQSTGDFASATSEDFSEDVRAWIAFLKDREEVDPERIGLVGHSEGGLIAPLVAAREPELDVLVLLAAPAVTGRTILLTQTRRIGGAAGMPTEQLDRQEKLTEGLVDLVLNPDRAPKGVELAEVLSEWEKTIQSLLDPQVRLPEGSAEAALAALRTPWMKAFLAHDPVPFLRQIRVPVLAVFCENDLQVLPDVNGPSMREALGQAPAADRTVVVLPGLNHMLQSCETGLPARYGELEETIAPRALELIGDWLVSRMHPQK